MSIVPRSSSIAVGAILRYAINDSTSRSSTSTTVGLILMIAASRACCSRSSIIDLAPALVYERTPVATARAAAGATRPPPPTELAQPAAA